MKERPRILFLSGLGCDQRMVACHRTIDADIEVVPWLEPLREDESLAAYAARLAATLDASRPFYLAGVSLGGMLAQEIARDVPVRGLLLIATCRANRGIPAFFRWGAWLSGRSPLWVIRLGRWSMPHMRRFFGITGQDQVQLFVDMLGDADPAFIRWSLRAIADWPGTAASTRVPTLQVHGRHDHVLPLRLAGAVNVVVEDAGHAMNVSHAGVVNRIVDGWLAEREGEGPAV